ncbi:MAG TPA: hypothetical protein VIP80_07665 [Gemmatimonadales bacterium]|jgi:hypothetical protein
MPRLSGMLRGGAMTISVSLTESHEEWDSFALRLGQSPYVFKCL